MARPPKENADYFSHDNDMRNDEKIKAVRLRFKHEGYSIWNMLLEKLCKAKDFTLCYSDLNIEMWAGDFDIEPDRLKEIIEYFLKIELILLHDGLIFSETMIARFSGLLNKRKRQSAALSQAIIKNEEVMGGDNPQSKVKESKVNNSKEKELIISELKIEDCKLPSTDMSYMVINASIKIYEGFQRKFPNNKDLPKKKVSEWVPFIRKLMQDKKYTYQQIEEILVWANNDKFWKNIIIDAESLEKHFEKLKLQHHG